MNDYDFYLYRIKIVESDQLNFFSDHISRMEIFKKLISEKPSSKSSNKSFWHIGNIQEIDEHGGCFAVGRTTKSVLQKYNFVTGDFVEEMDETSPYTFVFYDSLIGILAIAQKNKLSQTVTGIANKLRRLFQSTDVAFTNNLKISIDPISDPKDFIEALESAYSISSFTFTFTKPNPLDVERFIQKPMEEYLRESNGREGSTTIKGIDLNSDILVSVTKSIAATGNDAKVKLKRTQKERAIRRSLHSNPAHFTIQEEKFNQKGVISEVREHYLAIRGENE